MPLTYQGRKTKRQFEKEYGKNEGENIFYAWLNKKSKTERKKYEKIKK
jgi:hypothetical protein